MKPPVAMKRITVPLAEDHTVVREGLKTVDKHRQNLMSKLNLHQVAHLTRYAIAEGIIQSSVRRTLR